MNNVITLKCIKANLGIAYYKLLLSTEIVPVVSNAILSNPTHKLKKPDNPLNFLVNLQVKVETLMADLFNKRQNFPWGLQFIA